MKLDTSKRESMKSLIKSLEILKIFLDGSDGMTLSEIAKKSGLNKTTIHRILAALIRYDYINQREKKGKYYLGTIFLNFSSVIRKRLHIKNVAALHLADLTRKLDEVVILVCWFGKENTISQSFYESETHNPLKIVADEHVGTPLHCTSSGKIILASMSEEELNNYFSKERKRYTHNTITDLNAMKNHLQSVKQLDMAIDDEEYWVGVRSVATGIRDAEGKLLGAICVTAPTVRLSLSRMNEISNELKKCAVQITKDLGNGI